MESPLQFCPRCKRDVAFETRGGAASCPACGFRYELSAPPHPAALGMAGDGPGGGSGFLQFLKLMAIALLVLMGAVAVVAGVVFVGCAVALRGK